MTVPDDLATLRRALIAARDFLNRLPLDDGASRQAVDREFIGVTLIPEGLLAADRVEAEVARLREGRMEDKWFIPEGDRRCDVVHTRARATCMKRAGHDGPHATPQGTWIDGPWCEYPERCSDCDGIGAAAGAHTERVSGCPTCEGTGRKKEAAT